VKIGVLLEVEEEVLYLCFLMKQLRKISTHRGTAFSTPPVICELYLLYSKRSWPSGMLIHQQNSYALRSRWCNSCCEAQSHGVSQQIKNPPCINKLQTWQEAHVVAGL
jgi:hypothetical protein